MGGSRFRWVVWAAVVALTAGAGGEGAAADGAVHGGAAGGFAAASAVGGSAAVNATPGARTAATGALNVAASVIPAPAHVALRSGSFAIGAGAHILMPKAPRAARVARYFADLIQKTGGIKLPIDPSGPVSHSIVFKLNAQVAGPEAYDLDISADRVVLSASDPRGLLYAAVTLWQLSTPDQAIPAMKISDSPRFAWRGLMLDSARHYQSPEFILNFIDWMALHKLNVLHWHLTDNQAWRLEIKKYPRLTTVGAWRVPAGAGQRLYGGFYSQETVRKIVSHALERNVTIVPEIDMPGHATAATVAYPQLANTVPAPAVVPSDWGVYSDFFDANQSTFEFFENVLAEVVSLFPGRYVHIGGDEADGKPHTRANLFARMGRFLWAPVIDV